MNHILNWGYPDRSYGCNFSNCVEKPEKSQDFNRLKLVYCHTRGKTN